MAYVPPTSSTFSTSISNYLSSWWKADKNKLDPISILALTALMRYKEPDTKMRINKDHQVEAQQPSEFFCLINWRGLCRFLQGASHEDLDIIKPSILQAAEWYEPHEEKNMEIRQLFQYVKEGLDSLCISYENKSGNTVSALDQWKELIDKACKEKAQESSPLDFTTQKVRELWHTSDLQEMNLLFREMSRKQGDTPLDKEKKCPDEIARLELIIRQKGERIKTIYSK